MAFKLFAHEPTMGIWVALVAAFFSNYNKETKSSAPDGDTTPVLTWMSASGALLVFWFLMYFFYFRRLYKKQVKDRKEFISFCEEDKDKEGGEHRNKMSLLSNEKHSGVIGDNLPLAENTLRGPHGEALEVLHTRHDAEKGYVLEKEFQHTGPGGMRAREGSICVGEGDIVIDRNHAGGRHGAGPGSDDETSHGTRAWTTAPSSRATATRRPTWAT